MDVSSQFLDTQLGRGGPRGQFANDAEGIEALAEFCRSHHVDVVAMEASGGYEQLAFGLLCSAGIGVAIVNARAVRRFAQSMHIFEKTDRIDAGVIAWYADTKDVVAMRPASVEQHHLKALVKRLQQLTETRQTQRNQRQLVTDTQVLEGMHQLLLLINQQINTLEQDITALISTDPLWQQLDKSFRTIKGVADRTVARLMAELPEIGVLSNKRISKLVGLAPLADDSGKHKGKRTIQWRASECAQHPVCHRHRRQPPQSGFCCLSRALVAGWQSEEGGSGRPGAQTTRALERQGQGGTQPVCCCSRACLSLLIDQPKQRCGKVVNANALRRIAFSKGTASTSFPQSTTLAA